MKRKIGILIICGIMAAATISMGWFINATLNNAHDPHEYKYYAKTSGTGFQVLKDGEWEDFYVKGINLGAALPGKWFTEFPEDKEVYLDWFDKMGRMHANCIRVYTLLPPPFYESLDSYNRQHPEAPLWLLQEIWPEENPEGHNYLAGAYVDDYCAEIERVVDAVHGQADIPARTGRAYGVYESDVSEYVLGYLVGRELEPDEIIATNEQNPGFSFSGDYLASTGGASPSEAWLAMNCNYVMKYEEGRYGSQHPVAIVSWPTLDVAEHDSEWNESGLKSSEYNDRVAIDINHFDTGPKMEAGFFGAYHIYPNYPDFMNNESGYDNYHDEDGRLRYGGYLQEFMAGHKRYPALVAEFGLPTGMGNAHTSPDGLNHGGLTEEQQGDGIVRMMKAIKQEGYAGGIIFEWMDEWAKKTWTTEPYMIPYDRHAYWHNALDPEQNYGLLAMEPEPMGEEYTETGNGYIQGLAIRHDAAFLYLDISLNKKPDFDNERLLIGLDTYDRGQGEFRFTPESDIAAPGGLEFLLDLSGEDSARFLVHPGYNIASYKHSSYASSNGVFEEINLLIGRERIRKDGSKIAAVYHNASQMKFGELAGNSYNNWYIDGSSLHIRIPWGLMNFTDPSSLAVLDDSTSTGQLSRDQLQTVKTEGIMISVLWYDAARPAMIELLSTTEPYAWEPWVVPAFKERPKASYYIIQDYFGSLE